MRKKLGLFVITRDQKENLKRYILPLVSFFDEVVIGDTGSKDGTKELLSNFKGVKLINIEWENFSKARNKVLEHMESKWVMFLDSDEEMESKDVDRIKSIVSNEKTPSVYFLVINDGGDKSYQLRIFWRKGAYFEGPVHEQLVFPKTWKKHFLDIEIKHYGYRNQKVLREKLLRNLKLLEPHNDPYLNFHKGKILFKLGRLEEALVAYRSFIQGFDKENPELLAHAIIDISAILKRLGKVDEGIETLEKSLKSFPPYPPLLYQLGKLYMVKGNKEKAIYYLKTFVKMEKKISTIPLNYEKMERVASKYIEILSEG